MVREIVYETVKKIAQDWAYKLSDPSQHTLEGKPIRDPEVEEVAKIVETKLDIVFETYKKNPTSLRETAKRVFYENRV